MITKPDGSPALVSEPTEEQPVQTKVVAVPMTRLQENRDRISVAARLAKAEKALAAKTAEAEHLRLTVFAIVKTLGRVNISRATIESIKSGDNIESIGLPDKSVVLQWMKTAGQG